MKVGWWENKGYVSIVILTASRWVGRFGSDGGFVLTISPGLVLIGLFVVILSDSSSRVEEFIGLLVRVDELSVVASGRRFAPNWSAWSTSRAVAASCRAAHRLRFAAALFSRRRRFVGVSRGFTCRRLALGTHTSRFRYYLVLSDVRVVGCS